MSIPMKNSTRLLPLASLLIPLSLASCGKSVGDPMLDGETGAETETGEPLDSDEDGLSDEEEAVLGTDPFKKDTDGDNYWDPWEIDEGTDPLDYDSRIYTGSWPYRPNKDDLDPGDWSATSQQKGSRFPRHEFVDHHGDMVDIYDFTNFTVNGSGDPAWFIVDLSAQWCGPCHNVANWIAGVDSSDTAWIQGFYPTVRDKVHDLDIWWLTFIVQNQAGGLPTLDDATSWFEVHKDNYIPILVDADNRVLDAYGAGAFPHFFLLTPEMEIEYFPSGADQTDDNPYPAVGLVDTYL